MSPLLRALTYSQAALEPVVQAMQLQSYVALDAFRRGHGSRDLFSTLGRTFLIAEELARLDHLPDLIDDIEAAHAALMHLNTMQQQGGGWQLSDGDYASLAFATAIFDAQLSESSLSDIARAEARTLEGLLRSERSMREVAELVC